MKRLKDRERRKKRIKRKLIGTSQRPRLSVFRSNKNLYAQLVDDIKAGTVLSLSTKSPEMKESVKFGGNVKAAQALGQALAAKAKSKGIEKVIFCRSGYLYHGRVKALAEAARKGGLVF